MRPFSATKLTAAPSDIATAPLNGAGTVSCRQILSLEHERLLARKARAERGENTDPISKVKVLVASVVDLKSVGKVIKCLKTMERLPDRMDLFKMVGKRNGVARVLIGLVPRDLVAVEANACQPQARSLEEWLQIVAPSLNDGNLDTLSSLLKAPEILDLPDERPVCKVEAANWSFRYWPVSFSHSRVYKQRFANLKLTEKRCAARHFMFLFAQGSRGALMVEPCSNEVIGHGIDQTKNGNHPLRHAPMECIDNACARIQAAREAHGVRDKQEDIGPRTKRRKVANEKNSFPNFDPIKTYLCTGMDFYTIEEPCMMCAMALLHSRIRRVFYMIPNKRRGALGGTQERLHCHPQLNHHYEVFQCSFSNED